MRRIVAFFAVLLCCGVYGGAHALASAGVDTPGVLEFGGLNRTYQLHVPANVERPAGLVINLHGAGETGGAQASLTNYNAVADQHGFAVVYPDGIDYSWADGRGASIPDRQGVDDVGFLVALADRLTDDLNIAPGKVFATGLSAGAFMATRLACQRADVVAAIAPVAGSLGSAVPCAPSRPVSVFATHGVADPVVPYAGGPMVGRGGPSDIVAPQAMAARWRDLDRCPAAPVEDVPGRRGAPLHGRGLRRWHRSRRSSASTAAATSGSAAHRTPAHSSSPPTPGELVRGNLQRNDGDAMSAGLFGLLDDVAAIARMAAASVDDIGAAAGRATAKAAGVVIDDTAVTPQYVHGIAAERELPIIKRIAIGSLRNKLLFILPAALLLSQFVPWLLTPILMLGATYLCYEGAEKVWGRISGHDAHAAPVAEKGEDAEKHMVTGAIRTDFILSAEIMVIALNEVADQAFLPRLIILVIVAVGDHRGGLRRRRRHREDGRRRAEPDPALVGVRAACRPRAGRRDAEAARRRSRRSGRWRCSGSAATSCSWEPTNSAGMRRTASFTTGRKPSTTSEASGACWPG